MDTIVITTDPADFGAGANDRVTFPRCTWHIDQGTLHIKQEGDKGNCAAFAPGAWRSVARGNVAAEVTE